MRKRKMTVTDGRKTAEIPFEEGETVLAALQRSLKFAGPCRGNGTCGQCLFDVVREDGSLKREMACRYPAREMTVKIRLVVPRADAFCGEYAETEK